MDACRCLFIALVTAFAAGFIAPGPAFAAEDDPLKRPQADEFFSITAYWENDTDHAKPNNPSDEHYTFGGGFSLAHHPDWAWDLAQWMPFADGFGEPDAVAVGYIVAQQIFTPENISLENPPRDDRPYAGYLFAGAFFQRARQISPRLATMDHFQIDAGVIGPSSLAEDAQTSVHEAFGGTDPRGWDTQLPDEFAIQAFIRKKWRFDLDEPGAFDVQIIPQLGAAVGLVYRHLEASATLRTGWNVPNDFGPGRLEDVAAATGGPRRGLGFYVFARAGGRLVEHNVFLEGSNYHDSRGVDEEPLVGELEGGLRLTWRGDQWGIEAGYSQTHQTESFGRQDGGDSFGAYTLSAFLHF